MAKAKPAPETHAPPDLMLVEKPPQPEPKKAAAAPAREAAAPPAAKTRTRRDLHPARVWPD